MTEELDNILSKFAIQILGTHTGATAFGTDGFNAKQALQALIDQECNKARIDELHILDGELGVTESYNNCEVTVIDEDYVDNRIAELKDTK